MAGAGMAGAGMAGAGISIWACAGALKSSEATMANVVTLVTIRQRTSLTVDSTATSSRL
jgi:hypothetical protein